MGNKVFAENAGNAGLRVHGRGRMKVSVEKLIDAAKHSNGIYSLMGQRLGLDYRTVQKYLDRVPEASAEFDAARETILDIAENNLHKIISDPNHPKQFDALVFMLRTIGKKRGYTERTETEIQGSIDADVSLKGVRPVFQFIGRDGKTSDLDKLYQEFKGDEPEKR